MIFLFVFTCQRTWLLMFLSVSVTVLFLFTECVYVSAVLYVFHVHPISFFSSLNLIVQHGEDNSHCVQECLPSSDQCVLPYRWDHAAGDQAPAGCRHHRAASSPVCLALRYVASHCPAVHTCTFQCIKWRAGKYSVSYLNICELLLVLSIKCKGKVW